MPIKCLQVLSYARYNGRFDQRYFSDRSKADEIDVEIKEMRRTANGMVNSKLLAFMVLGSISRCISFIRVT